MLNRQFLGGWTSSQPLAKHGGSGGGDGGSYGVISGRAHISHLFRIVHIARAVVTFALWSASSHEMHLSWNFHWGKGLFAGGDGGVANFQAVER